MHFGSLYVLNRDWAIEHKGDIFQRDGKAVWKDVFGSYIRYNQPFRPIFEILHDEFEYTVENLNILTYTENDRKGFVDRLGQHLFTYYLWNVYPLRGNESLLERFYDKTTDDRERWAQLFDYVGRSLQKRQGPR